MSTTHWTGGAPLSPEQSERDARDRTARAVDQPDAIGVPEGTGVLRRLPPWAVRGAVVFAALVLGFLVTIGIFVSLPALGGLTRFDIRRRSQEWNASRESGSFQVFGPVQVTPSSVSFSWVSPGDSLFAAYEVHYSREPHFSPSAATLFEKPITEPSATSAEVTGLECSTTYYFRVRLRERTGRSFDSQEMAARTQACPDSTNPLMALSYDYEYGYSRPWDDPLSYGAVEDSIYDSYANNDSYGGIADSHAADPATGLDRSTTGSDTSNRAGLDSESTAGPETAGSRVSGRAWPSRRGSELDGSGAASGREASHSGVHVQAPARVDQSSADVTWSEESSPDFEAYEVHVGQSPGFNPSALTLRAAPIHSASMTRLSVSGLRCDSVYYLVVRTCYTDGSVSTSNVQRFTTERCSESGESPTSQGP